MSLEQNQQLPVRFCGWYYSQGRSTQSQESLLALENTVKNLRLHGNCYVGILFIVNCTALFLIQYPMECECI